MTIVTSLAIYFIIWWLVLFAVLPWGIHSQQESGDYHQGTDPGAPAIPNLARKLIWTTVVAVLVFAILQVVYSYELVSLDALTDLIGMPR
jgi:predicted secreted protein